MVIEKGICQILLICSMLLFQQNLYGQQNSLAHAIGKKDGFSESTVYAILKDRKGFMWYGASDGLWRYDGYLHKHFQHDPKNPNSLSHNFVTCLIEDREGNLWAGTLAGGLNKFNPATNSFYHFKHDEKDSTTLFDNYISEITEDQQGNIWVCSGKLSLLNKATNHFIHFDNKEIIQWGANSVYASKTGLLWIGSTGDGFAMFDPKTNKFKNYHVNHSDPVVNDRVNVIRIIKEDPDGNIWLGTYGGLVKFDTRTEKITHWVHEDAGIKSLAHNSIWDMEFSEKGKVWIATWGGGISCFDIATGLFENETFKPGGLYQVGSLEFPSVYQEQDGTLWFGSNAKGVFRIKTMSGLSYLRNTEGLLRKNIRKVIKGKEYTYFISDVDGLIAFSEQKGVAFTLPPWRDKKPNGLSGNRISSVSESTNGTLFIGTDFGLTIYNPASKKIKYLLNNTKDSTSLSHNSVLTTFVDSKDRLWAGTPFGLNLLLPETNTFAYWKRQTLSGNSVLSIGETKEGIWIGTSTGGLNLLNLKKQKVIFFQYDEKNDSTISGNLVDFIYTDTRNDLWIGTRTGLNKYHPATHHFERYRIPDAQIFEISENTNRNLFIYSSEGFYELILTDNKNDEGEGEVEVEIKKMIFPLGTFSGLWSANENRRYLFAEKEIGYLDLDTFVSEQTTPAITITDFQLDPNNKHPLDSAEATRSPAHQKEITLDYDQNLFSIEFAALDFTNPSANQYAYQLEGFDEDWTYSGTRRFVTYTNLSPGSYTFKAKGSNYAGVWNEEGATLSITILPPPWKTWWAYTGYALAFIGLLFVGRKTIVNRERLQAQVLVEQKEKQTLKELDNLKTKFFSNITHEFRTPLTLIQGPANELLEKTNDPEAKKLLTMIKNNSARLLTLINQLLDLAKLDAQEVKLNTKSARLDVLLKTTVSQFTSLASSRLIHLEWRIPSEAHTVLIDEEKVETILINLISNALKFTPARGIVLVSATYTNQLLEVEVKDNGRGIPVDKLAHIFDRFYQVEATDSSHSEGTGIGLALVKEYIELMKGVIQVESEVAVGTVFKISIPLSIAPAQLVEEPTTVMNENPVVIEEHSIEDSELPLLLIVEDNEDIRSFIKTCLGNPYRYSEARHGREGLEKSRHEIPDLIISDLMMPEMDGMQLCHEIKKDSRTNHIPFIMLTAKAAEESKIEGLQTGADDYLIKPFNKAELLLKVRNLILLREKLQIRIKNNLLSQATMVVAQSTGEQFIVKTKAYIEANLKEEKLTVETLATELALSREQCYRKILALTGLSPSAFIRKLRLQKAAQLLAVKWGPVSQIAYEVGFENLSYFSKAFKEEFGKLPSEY
jgi:signal transduction histidine kinase/ligand-binding sensor domain-containing protein/DNA-binding response OmpR family regulator